MPKPRSSGAAPDGARSGRRRHLGGVLITLLLVAAAAGPTLLGPLTAPTRALAARAAPAPLFQDAESAARQGGELLRAGDLEGALAQYDQALTLYRQAGHRPGELFALLSMGNVYLELGQNERALEAFQQSLAGARELGLESIAQAATQNLGAVYFNLGRYAEAQALTEQALATASGADEPQRAGVTAANLGVILDRQGDAAGALRLYERALAEAQTTGDLQAASLALYNLSVVHYNARDYVGARTVAEQSLALAREQGDRAAEGAALQRLGEVHEALGDLNTALSFFQQAMVAREDVRGAVRLDEFRASLAAQFVDTYDRMVLLHWRLGQVAEAFHISERARARSFLDQLGSGRPTLGRAADPARLQQEQALRAEIIDLDEDLRRTRADPVARLDSARLAVPSAQLASKYREYEDLITQLRLSDPEAAQLVTVNPLTLAEVQATLDGNTTLLSYYVMPERTLAFVVRRDSVQAVELPISEQALRELIGEFRQFSDRERAPASLDQLAARLVAPLAPQLTTPVLAIVPHGPLHYAPFAALRVGDGYLSERYTLHYLPTASAIPFIRAKRRPAADRLVAMAQSEATGLPRLRYAEVEVDAIARLYGTQSLVGAAATKTNLRARMADLNILHLAAHGELNAVSPLFSRIFLAPDGGDDGTLTVHDVYSLTLNSADLVVLSACETQLGAQSRGDDVVGLSRAFIYAGTPSVIASLWSVNDQATAVLMTAFYQQLRAGASKAQALRAAQAETRARYPHPYYWAAFVLTGDPGGPPAGER